MPQLCDQGLSYTLPRKFGPESCSEAEALWGCLSPPGWAQTPSSLLPGLPEARFLNSGTARETPNTSERHKGSSLHLGPVLAEDKQQLWHPLPHQVMAMCVPVGCALGRLHWPTPVTRGDHHNPPVQPVLSILLPKAGKWPGGTAESNYIKAVNSYLQQATPAWARVA